MGLIPARAGNTGDSIAESIGAGAHPRSRGEHVQLNTPPPPWRKGLIPARAGNTCAVCGTGCFRWAHPRSRGEHRSEAREGVVHVGSSPLARGTPPLFFCQLAGIGLIPARAGNTYRIIECKIYCRAHPRSRGEHVPSVNVIACCAGSSPLARGTPITRVSGTITRGLIPARAGNTEWHKAHSRD